jgi:hypothetical protein
MNLRSIAPQNLIAAGALIAPIVIVQGVRMLFGSGPSDAHAAVTTVEPVPAVAPAPTEVDPRRTLTPAQKAAAAELAEHRTRITVFTSPFNHLAPKATVIQNDQIVAHTPDNAKPVVIPAEIQNLSLGSTMRNSNGAFAVIAGRVRSVGDEVVPGWKITEIDPTERSVTLTSNEGVTVTLTRQ